MSEQESQVGNPVEQSTDTIQSKTAIARQLAQSHYATCPGDWQPGLGAAHGAAIRRFLSNTSPTEEDINNITRLIEWRESTMDRLDTLITSLGLPRPFGLRCALWNRAGGISTHETSELRERYERIWIHLDQAGFYEIFHEVSCGFRGAQVPFRRPAFYVAACMALGSYDEAQVVRVFNEVKQSKENSEGSSVLLRRMNTDLGEIPSVGSGSWC